MNMRLSEAIRLGSAVTGQAYNINVDRYGRTCALGAAGIAFGGGSQLTWPTDVVAFARSADRCICPLDHCFYDGGVGSLIVHLNDHHKWLREDIADWVEMLELLYYAPPEPEPEPDEEPEAALAV